MSEEHRHEGQRYQIAKSYVDKQLETMREAGAAPKDMSEAEYKKIIEEIEDTIES